MSDNNLVPWYRAKYGWWALIGKNWCHVSLRQAMAHKLSYGKIRFGRW